jgi:phage-related tail fiber protein
MANEFFTILTATGRNKLAAATATATPLALTQMAVGRRRQRRLLQPERSPDRPQA